MLLKRTLRDVKAACKKQTACRHYRRRAAVAKFDRMCHHYIGVRERPQHLQDEFSVRSNLHQLTLPEAGFYPLAEVPVIRLTEGGERELAGAQWGLLPAWWKPSDRIPKRESFQRRCINARAEDVHAKPTYRESFRRRRCLMPGEAFFERGHYFHLLDDRAFAFAAIWDRWRDADGRDVDTCTLLTTEANEAVAAVGHPRMPVVLAQEDDYARWLNPEVVERSLLERLLRPTPAEIWRCRAAAPKAQRLDPRRSQPGDDVSSTRAKSQDDPRRGGSSQGRLFD